jgi:hypothetical protein
MDDVVAAAATVIMLSCSQLLLKAKKPKRCKESSTGFTRDKPASWPNDITLLLPWVNNQSNIGFRVGHLSQHCGTP